MNPDASSADQPWPVRRVANSIAGWVHRLGAVWVEGQVTGLNKRPGTSFLTLRDPVAEVSLSVTIRRELLDACQPPVIDGSKVIVHARPDFFLGRGALSLQAREIRTVGLGELLARIERVKNMLDAEGLFDVSRKRPLPFLPTKVGLITGRASDAKHDVVTHTNHRWPAVAFRVEEVLVQGPAAVGDVIDALARLDHDHSVDVIVIARGGGSVEDLLPFSDEQLLRAVAHTATPVISAIGHERDSPLLDLVADVRASTPTDAARRLVPDVAEERAGIDRQISRARHHIGSLIRNEETRLSQISSRPALARPTSLVDVQQDLITQKQLRVRKLMESWLDRASDVVTNASAHLRAMSPQATLERGYAILQTTEGAIVRSTEQVAPRKQLHVRVSDGVFDATVDASS